MIVRFTGLDGAPRTGLYDSGTSEMVFLKSLVKGGSITCRKIGEREVEVVGGTTTKQTAYSVALPIVDDSYTFQEIRGLAIPLVITDLPELDYSAEVDESYEAYVQNCKENGKSPAYRREDFPTGEYGGSNNKIEFLLGMAALEFNQLFTYNGLTFFTTNLDTGKERRVLFGGKWNGQISTRNEETPSRQISSMAVYREQPAHPCPSPTSTDEAANPRISPTQPCQPTHLHPHNPTTNTSTKGTNHQQNNTDSLRPPPQQKQNIQTPYEQDSRSYSSVASARVKKQQESLNP